MCLHRFTSIQGVREGSIRIGEVWVLAAPQGFEPRYADPESAVLPLNEGATSAERPPCSHVGLAETERSALEANCSMIRIKRLSGQTSHHPNEITGHPTPRLLLPQYLERPQPQDPVARDPASGCCQNRRSRHGHHCGKPVDLKADFQPAQKHPCQQIGKNHSH